MKAPLLSGCNNPELSSTAKPKKLNSVACYNGIDTLPDEILIIILSYLSLKEAVRTSVLSHRWRYLWRFTSGSLEFHLHHHTDRNKRHQPPRKGRATAREFDTLVNQILKLHQAPFLHKFILRYHGPDYDAPPNSSICNWIFFAMQRDVRVFELDLSWNPDFPDLDQFLSISRAVVPNPTKDTIGLSSLTSLTLANFNHITQEMIEYLLSNCPHLEHLCLKYLGGLKNLNIVVPCLKSLIILYCHPLVKLEISAANLLSLTCRSERPLRSNVEFRSIPLLSEVTLDGEFFSNYFLWPDKYLRRSDQLQKLVLRVSFAITHMSRSFIGSFFEYGLPQLQHLKHLELVLETADYMSLPYFVLLTGACPFLSTYILQFIYQIRIFDEETKVSAMQSYGTEDAQLYHTAHRHEYLKVVKLMNFACYRSEFRFALSLLQITKSLEKLIIAPGPGYSGLKRTTTVRERAKQLEANLPPGAELVIL